MEAGMEKRSFEALCDWRPQGMSPWRYFLKTMKSIRETQGYAAWLWTLEQCIVTAERINRGQK